MTSDSSTARILEVINALVGERQELRRTGADKPLLEANRVAIVYWQQRLGERAAEEHGVSA